jgi:hypothetical protein
VLIVLASATIAAAAGTDTCVGAGAIIGSTCTPLTNTTSGNNENTAFGFQALDSNTTGSANTATGVSALTWNTTGNANTATGSGALFGEGPGSTGGGNTATGFDALDHNTTGDDNTAAGADAMQGNTTGIENTATGKFALNNNTTGGSNIGIGSFAGDNLTTGDNNIDIGNEGRAAESNTIRIGTKGVQTRTVIAGINNSPVFGSPVVVNIYGRLGIQASSARFKRDIRDMGDASGRLMKLRPVTFRYKEDPAGTPQYGLIAEEVARVYPELVSYGADGKVETVAYHLLPAMLLNEMQKQIRENQRKDARIAALQQQLVAQQRQIGALQKETARIDTLTARLGALEQQARTARPERLAAAAPPMAP